jgi:membrane protein YdbS with pleckstrin-like domain
MLPGFVGCAVATLAAAGAWWYAPWDRGTEASLLAQALIAAIASLWLWQLFRWGYRLAAFQIRLTNRRLFLYRGMLYPELGVWRLAEVSRVEFRPAPLTGWLGVGAIQLHLGGQPGDRIELPAVARPRYVAELLKEQVASARQEQVVLKRVQA